jgi:hypothetical protein
VFAGVADPYSFDTDPDPEFPAEEKLPHFKRKLKGLAA